MKPKIYIKTTSLSDALSIWDRALTEANLNSPLGYDSVPVTQALGRVTASPVIARLSSPFYHSAAMDGYAVRFTDTFGASEAAPKRLNIGADAIYVDTGDPVPDGGFNVVVMIEDVQVIDGTIEIIAAATPWQQVRTVGEDIVATELIAPESHRVRPVDIGAMQAGGVTHIAVRRRPRVAIIPTGTEIVEPKGDPKKGEIIEANSRVLEGMVTELGGEPVRMAIVPDDKDRLMAALTEATRTADMAIVIAGASTGTEDYTSHVIESLGKLLLHGLSIKPGKPGMLGIVNGKPVVGTPGYPVACHLIFTLFARPVIRRWLGLSADDAETARAIISRQVASSLGQEEFLRVKLGEVGGRLVATPLGRGAGLLMSLVRADGIVRVPDMSEGLAAGSEVDVTLLRPLRDIKETVVIIGSHDMCLDVLANALHKRYPRYSLSSAHVGSMGGLMALKRGEAHIATTHLLDEETGGYNVSYIEKLIPEQRVTLVNLVHRTQGLMVLPANPKGITEISHLRRRDVMFINRQRGAGTRLLLDKSLRELGISPDEIKGYDKEEYTHMAVASAVLTGVADVGLGVLSAARALGLDFVPFAQERYDLAIPEAHMGLPRVRALLDIVQNDREFRDAVEALGGYGFADMGKVMHAPQM